MGSVAATGERSACVMGDGTTIEGDAEVEVGEACEEAMELRLDLDEAAGGLPGRRFSTGVRAERAGGG